MHLPLFTLPSHLWKPGMVLIMETGRVGKSESPVHGATGAKGITKGTAITSVALWLLISAICAAKHQ